MNPEQERKIAIELTVEQWKVLLDWSKTEQTACGLNEVEKSLTNKIKKELKAWAVDVSGY